MSQEVRPGEDRGCTVAELIAHLQTMPPDARVTYAAWSETNPLRIDEVTLVRAEERQLFFHNGIYIQFDPRYFRGAAQEHHRAGTEPEFATVVCFPGN